ncbi:MAG: c-type cytochrome [Leadbetterella sp.]
MLNFISKKVVSVFAICLVFSSLSFAQEGDAAAGETLFKNNCAQCHSAGGDVVVGPGLKGIEDRRDYAWLKKWINNNQAVTASGDKYAVELVKKFNNSPMTQFPGFGDPEVKNILAYITKFNLVPPTPTPGDSKVTPNGGGESNGKFFTILLVVICVIMLLVLVALFSVLNLLNKLSKDETSEEGKQSTNTLSNNLKALGSNSTIRSAIVWLFVILGTKASLDGLYKIGVHQGYAPKQPINFSHKLHAGEMEINCANCHTGVYKGKQAGIPSASICMTCHNSIKRESPEIQKIYKALEKDQPIEWVRVHNLPDLAYFNHAQHTNVGGLECKNCHGEINKMEVVQQRSTLTMGWCIDCHRKTDVNHKGNEYYASLLKAHESTSKESMKVEDIGGLECSKCHY